MAVEMQTEPPAVAAAERTQQETLAMLAVMVGPVKSGTLRMVQAVALAQAAGVITAPVLAQQAREERAALLVVVVVQAAIQHPLRATAATVVTELW
jgi:hypothetical protein